MRLDKAAFNALHIFPAEKSDNRTPTNVLGYLNKGRTPMGFRKLQSWLRQPLVDRVEIERRHSLLEALVEDGSGEMRLQRIQSCLRYERALAVADLGRVSWRANSVGWKLAGKLF